MGRAEFKSPDGHTMIAYGLDHMTGYFLTCTDYRIQYDSDASEEVNDVCKTMEGAYFNLHTGLFGFGHKVSVPTLLTFWQRYGVPDRDILAAKARHEVPSHSDDHNITGQPNHTLLETDASSCRVTANTCLICQIPTTLKCSRCGVVYACSSDHSKKAWNVHKPQCKSRPDSPDVRVVTTSRRTEPLQSKHPIEIIKGYLFSEDGTLGPELVDVQVERKLDEDDQVWYHTAGEGAVKLFGQKWENYRERPWSLVIQVDQTLGSQTLFHYDDFSLNPERYKINQAVLKLTNNSAPHPWAGPMLLMQQKRGLGEFLEDATEGTLEAAKEYFRSYGRI